MSKPNIKSLNKMAFLKVMPNRKEKIAAAEAKKLPELSEYKANQLAAALHPVCQHLKISEVIERTKDVKSFVMVPNKEKGTESLAYFNAGQYLSISLNINGATVTRPYSISSSPREALAGKYMLTIKRTEGGLVSEYALDHWVEGSEILASAPLGDFTYEPLRDAKKVIGIAGGSGITPFLSLAQAIADGDEDADLTLLYGSCSLEDALFQDEFKVIAEKCSRFRFVNILSETPAEACEIGFITKELILKYAPEGEYSIFLCGPQEMYNFVDREIAQLGLRNKFIRHELFGEYRNPEKDTDYPTNKGDSFMLTVRICGEEKEINCSAHDTLLVTMERNGIQAPARCRSGTCGWCHSHLISGEVYIPKSVDGRRLADFDFGYIHPCCTFPLSDIVIDVPPFKA